MPRLPTFGTPVNKLDHERLLALVNSMTDGVLALDRKGLVVMSNGVALDILNTNTITGKHVDEVLKLVDRKEAPLSLGKMLQEKNNGLTSRDWQLRYQDGTAIYLFVSAAPVRLGFGSSGQGGYVVILRDISREKSLEEERDEFISVASHELRTPVAIAEGNISNILMMSSKVGLDSETRRALETAHEQIVFLGNMLNDLSTLSRAEQGKLAMLVEKVSPAELVQSLVHDYRPQALKKQLTLEVENHGPAGELSTSRLYVREILQNLITNAIKYTEKGGATITVEARDGGVEFAVTDTGIGIGRNEQAKLFEKFFRSSDFRVKNINGTGLGLYVAMKLTKLIGGRLSFDSELNRGSTFRLFVPDLPAAGRLK
jgi:PAS domain S-box-containing protein